MAEIGPIKREWIVEPLKEPDVPMPEPLPLEPDREEEEEEEELVPA